MTTTETCRYRGYDIVPMRQWSSWCVGIYMEYATEGEQDVGHLKEFGLQGLPHVCAHGVRLPKAVKVAGA